MNNQILTYRQLYRENHRAENREYQKKYYLKHRVEKLAQQKLRRPQIREYKRKWDRQRMKDPIHRLNNNIRGNMYHALKAKKGFRKWEDLVGYSLQDLINHIDPLLQDGMTWENYGTYWSVDHITPKSWFKYQSTEDPKFKECWELSNLQPKERIENIRKGNRYRG